MKKTLIYILSLLCLSSCLDLDKFPEDSMSPESFFSNQKELEAFSNNFYSIFPGSGLYSESADTYTQTILPNEISGMRVVPASGGGWNWGNLRNVNTLLAYSGNCKEKAVREHYDALAKFFRAYFYYDKVRMFGDVPWYDKPLDSDDEALNKPRDSRELIMTHVMEDLDEAIRVLPADKDLYRITRWSALAMKSRICLFEGTFRKYHGINLEGHDWKWYLEEGVKAAQEVILTSGYRLHTEGGPATCYLNLFSSENAVEDEVILARDYNPALGVFHNANMYTLGGTNGQPGMSKKMVASYLMKDGTRFTDTPGWETMEFVEECKNRDPRLAQSIRTPGYHRIGETTGAAPDLKATVTGYQPIKYVTGKDADSFNKSYNDLIIIRLAEVYLNYAEAKAELETLTQHDLDITVNLLRDRVSMPHLEMSAANADPDPFLMAEETGYPGVNGANKGVILEIRRERAVELAQEGFRYYDIIRWKEGNTYNQPLRGMYFHGPGEYDLNADGKPDLYLWKDTKGTTKAPLVMEIGEQLRLSEGDKGYIKPHNQETQWNEDRDYYYPIPTDDLTLTMGALKQNPGWSGDVE